MMENSPVCWEFKPHPFRKLCEGCRNPKIEHHIDDEKEHQVRLQSLLGESPPAHQQGDENYAWVPTVQPPATVEMYFAALPEALVPKRGTAAEQVRRKAWRVQVPIQDVSMEHLRFLQPELKNSFENFVNHLREDSFNFGFVMMWNKQLPIQCVNCLTLIEEDELVVMSPKSALNVYHPNCFICTDCKEQLVDLAHCFGPDGKVYCERHYAERHKKRCHACDEQLFCFRYVQSSGQFYHKDHLLCFNCDSVLDDSGGFQKHEELFCSKCYEQLHCHDCVKCQNRIRIEDKHVSFKENHWHSDCFTCEICKESLTKGPFQLHDRHYYCYQCFESHKSDMYDSESETLKFECCVCNSDVDGKCVIIVERLEYCKSCYYERFMYICNYCGLPIFLGTLHKALIAYENQRFHENCSSKVVSEPSLADRIHITKRANEMSDESQIIQNSQFQPADSIQKRTRLCDFSEHVVSTVESIVKKSAKGSTNLTMIRRQLTARHGYNTTLCEADLKRALQEGEEHNRIKKAKHGSYMRFDAVVADNSEQPCKRLRQDIDPDEDRSLYDNKVTTRAEWSRVTGTNPGKMSYDVWLRRPLNPGLYGKRDVYQI